MTIDDLIVTRLAARLLPSLRGALLLLLDDCRDGLLPRGVLGALRERGILSPEDLASVEVGVARYKRGRALSIYQDLLVQAGCDRQALADHVTALGQQVSVPALSERVLRRGLLAAEAEATARFQARVLFDADLARQVDEHRAARAAVGEPAERPRGPMDTGRFAAQAQLPTIQSAVFRLDAPLPAPPPEEVAEIVSSGQGALESSDLPGGPPGFGLPDWVDTAIAGREPLVVDDYRLLARVGVSRRASVLLGYHLKRRDRPVVLKLLRAGQPREARQRLEREARLLARIKHPLVPPVIDRGEEDGRPYLVFDFFPGRPLGVEPSAAPPMAPRRATAIFARLLEALDAVHAAGVIHRDIKPENVLLDARTDEVRLIDFGTGKRAGDPEEAVAEGDFLTAGRPLLGTPRYMAPEQAQGAKVDERADLYAAGVLLFELIAGAPPFEGDGPLAELTARIDGRPRTLVEVRPEARTLPVRFHRYVGALLRPDPAGRPSSAREALEGLREATRGLPPG
ncbi:MAG: serine/threonine protein kinase [Planctomycetes bacterium]|nr:serine/threonine protein kinase [Planctomycetota bacterium]